MKTFADIIEAFGGVHELSRALDVPYPTVANWKHRNTIPSDHWVALIAAAKRQKPPLAVAADLLVALAAKRSAA